VGEGELADVEVDVGTVAADVVVVDIVVTLVIGAVADVVTSAIDVLLVTYAVVTK
jgi:hypothetical protein